jgi:hypothetical protein
VRSCGTPERRLENTNERPAQKPKRAEAGQQAPIGPTLDPRDPGAGFPLATVRGWRAVGPVDRPGGGWRCAMTATPFVRACLSGMSPADLAAQLKPQFRPSRHDCISAARSIAITADPETESGRRLHFRALDLADEIELGRW